MEGGGEWWIVYCSLGKSPSFDRSIPFCGKCMILWYVNVLLYRVLLKPSSPVLWNFWFNETYSFILRKWDKLWRLRPLLLSVYTILTLPDIPILNSFAVDLFYRYCNKTFLELQIEGSGSPFYIREEVIDSKITL